MTDRPWGLYYGTGKDLSRYSTFVELENAKAKADDLARKKWTAPAVHDERTGAEVYRGQSEPLCSLCGEPHLEGTCLI